MKIKSNSAPQELNSPFFEANEKFCHEFECFIASKNGKVKGNYNAWSYMIYGKIKANNSWDLQYKKATYSSSRSLFSIFNRTEILLNLAQWTCNNVNASDSSFLVRKKTFLDWLNPSFSRLRHHQNYVIKKMGKQSKFFSQVINVLHPLFESQEIYSIHLKNNKLTIELRSDQHHFDIFNELIQV